MKDAHPFIRILLVVVLQRVLVALEAVHACRSQCDSVGGRVECISKLESKNKIKIIKIDK